MHAFVVTHGLSETGAGAHAELAAELTPAVAAVPGLVGRTCLENSATGRVGCFYVFETKSACDRFVASELYGALYEHPAVIGLIAHDFVVRVPVCERRIA
jgi:hypothetical protein